MDYTIDTLPSRLTLGRQTETGVTDIRIDMSEWLKQWPELAISIWPTRPGEKPRIRRTRIWTAAP